VGVDLSRRSVERAQAAVYDERALRAVVPEVRASYFERRGSGFSPLAAVRNAVQFVQGNLLNLRAPGGIDRFDVVFCRNVLIYLTPQARSAVFSTLDRLLEPGGLLVLGHAESLPTSQLGYSPVSDAASFAYRRQSAAPPAEPLRLDLPALPSSTRPTAVEPSTPPKPRPPAARRPTPPPSQPAGLLDLARDLANRHEHDQAIAACQKAIQVDGPSAAAFHLLGMIQQTAGRYAEAEACLGRAVYLDPTDDDALLALALLARRRGDEAAFRRFNRQADRLRTNRGGA
jgi:chemotaxis protein methyltransferase WspC